MTATTFLMPACAVIVFGTFAASGVPGGSLPVSANEFRSARSASRLMPTALPWPAAPCAIVSTFEMLQPAHPTPCFVKTRSAPGYFLTTSAMSWSAEMTAFTYPLSARVPAAMASQREIQHREHERRDHAVGRGPADRDGELIQEQV